VIESEIDFPVSVITKDIWQKQQMVVKEGSAVHWPATSTRDETH
jgi:hypothetical protein